MFSFAAIIFRMFSGVGSVIKAIFSDWRILLAVLLLCAATFGFYKWHGLQKDIAAQREALEQTKKANEVLESNNKALHDANEQNVLIIEQVKKDQQQTLVQVHKLNTDLASSSKKISDLKSQLGSIKTPPVQISPYIATAIDGIQKMQGDKK